MIKNRKSQKGTAVIFIIGMLACVIIYVTASMRQTVHASKSIKTLDDKLVAREMAFAGLEMAKESIYTSQNATARDLEIVDELTEGNFFATIEHPLDSEDFRITSTGTCGQWKAKVVEIVKKD